MNKVVNDVDMTRLSEIGRQMQKEQAQLRLRDFFRNKSSVAGLIMVSIMVILAILAPVITQYEPNEMVVKDRLMAPCATHWFGTDSMGRDVYTSVIYGARVSLTVGAVVALGSGVLGMIIGV